MTTTQRNRRLGMGLGLLIALAVVLWLIFGGHRYVTTENAYIKIDMISLTADVSGPLVAVNVERNQPVQRGQVLAEVDPQPYRIALAEARADQRAVRNRILSERADYARLQAQRAQARRDLSYYQRELQRFQGLDKVAVSQSQLEAARQKRDKARADAEVERLGNAPVPASLRDAHYKGAKRLGHGVGYAYPHDDERGWVDQQYGPDGLRRIYEPGDHGAEPTLNSWRDSR